MLHSTKLLILAASFGLLLSGCNSGSSSSFDPSGSQQPPAGSAPPPDDNGSESPNDDGDSGETPPTDGGMTPPANQDPDNDAPAKTTIVATDPQDHDEGVAPVTAITVTYDDLLDPQSVVKSQVSLLGPNGETSVDVEVDGATLIIKPTSKLAAGASYTATVKSGIRSLAGASMETDYSWQFVTAKGLTGLCADFYSSGFALIGGKDATSPSSFSKPARGKPYKDPAYGTCVTRASNASGELGVGWVRNDYSRRQAFNADDSLYLVIARYSRWFIHDTNTTKIVRELNIRGGGIEPQWHPTDPDILFIFDNLGGFTIRRHNVRTGTTEIVADFRNVASINGHPGLTSIRQVWSNAARVWTRWEGSPSKDARYWGLMVQTSDEVGIGMITYDMETNTITGVYDYAKDGGGVREPDHVSITPSGSHIVPSWTSPECGSQLGTRSRPCGLMSFSRDFSRAIGLAARTSHSDIGLDANGRDAIVAANYNSGWVEMWDTATGSMTRLMLIYENSNSTAMHISAKNYDKPGWVLVSTYAGKFTGWYSNKLFALEMKSNPRILNIAHTYNQYINYWTEPHAVVNRDFTRILFNSNWRSGNENSDVYMIALPDDAVPAR